MGSCVGTRSLSSDTAVTRRVRSAKDRLYGESASTHQSPSKTLQGGCAYSASCSHQSILLSIKELNESPEHASSSACEKWISCAGCSMLFHIQKEGYVASAPLLQDPMLSSSLAGRRQFLERRLK